MKRTLCGAMACAVMALWVFSAWCQDDVMQLKSDGTKPRERPAVTFPHEKHAGLMECSRCHHDYDAYGVNRGSEGRRCAECHGDGSANPIPLQRAYHEQCLSCHERLNARQGRALPVLCGQCHVR